MQFKFHFKIVVFILSTTLLFSNIIVAQEEARVKKSYITKDGVKTPIVFDPFTLKNDKSKFLYDNPTSNDRTSRYDKLKDAINDTEQVRVQIDSVQSRSTDSEGTFSVAGAKKKLELLNKEKNMTNSNVTTSLEELVFMKEKYGDKPSFFINDIEVDQDTFNKVPDRESLNKQVYIQNTISGNPNGEIRIMVSERTLKRLKLTDPFVDTPTESVSSYAFAQPVLETKDTKNIDEISTNNNSNDNASLDQLLKDIMQLDNNKVNTVRENTTNRTTNVQKSTLDLKEVKKEIKLEKKQPTPQREIVYSYDEINSKSTPIHTSVKKNEEEVFVVRTSDWKRVENIIPTNKADETNMKEEKRSVRDIKNREREK